MKASEIKKFFKNLGIPVRVRTVACKHSFAQVWISPEKNADFRAPLKYNFSFPVELREKLLKIIYGPDCKSLPGREGNAGNVSAHSISFSGEQWEKLTAK